MTSPPLVAEQPHFGRRLAGFTAWAYLGATLLGVVMRFDLVGVRSGLAFDHLLHAHSHTLYFGWAALGVLAAARASFRLPTSLLRWSTAILVATTPLLFLGFLATGYHPFTIAVSTVVMLAWYGVAAVWWSQCRHLEPLVALAFRYGLSYLVASSLGIWALAVIQATGGSDLAQSLAVHAFLLGFGWFLVFMVLGAVMFHRHRLGLSIGVGAVTRSLHGWAAVAWATFPLGVVGGPEVWGLGPIARVAGFVILIPSVAWIVAWWKAAQPGPTQLLHRVSAMWFGLATFTTAVAASTGSAALLAAGRQGVVIYLHAVFAGLVTPLLVLALSAQVPLLWLRVHHGGLAAMLIGLAMVTLGSAVLGMWVAAAGAVVLWFAGLGWAWPLLRGLGW
jgi:hypothetical protein